MLIPVNTCRWCLKPEHPSGTICSFHPDFSPLRDETWLRHKAEQEEGCDVSAGTLDINKLPPSCGCIPCSDCGGSGSWWKPAAEATDASDGEEVSCDTCHGTGYSKDCSSHKWAAETVRAQKKYR